MMLDVDFPQNPKYIIINMLYPNIYYHIYIIYYPQLYIILNYIILYHHIYIYYNSFPSHPTFFGSWPIIVQRPRGIRLRHHRLQGCKDPPQGLCKTAAVQATRAAYVEAPQGRSREVARDLEDKFISISLYFFIDSIRFSQQIS